MHEALDFAGSALEAMLAGSELPDMDVTDPDDDLGGDHIPDHDEEEDTPPPSTGDDEDMGLDDLDDLD